ncbi:MAG: serine/threonine-protein kinase [Kofleriaceae bacterium]
MSTGVKTVDAGVEIGQVLLGKYRVERVIGHGGMGVVVECTHLQLGGRYAIKLLRKDALVDQDAVERFDREAKAASRLKSEYVAKVTDVGSDGGVPVMVMEYLEGHNLGEMLEESGKVGYRWACDMMLQTAEALAEAHSLGIVHRDIKPTNLFVTWRPDGTAIIKVLDFGISKTSMGTDMNLTQTQSLLGTPAYMSPEQMRSARLVDWRSDIWSLGTVFYELLEGHRPFDAESFSEMCVKVAVDPPAPMVHTPPALQPVILRCLAKTPEQRYATMAELGRDLIPFVQDPHQAGKLVERMLRTLRRSQGWDDAAESDISDVRAIAARASNPHLPIVTIPPKGAASGPVAALSTTLDVVQPKRRILPLLGGLVAFVGIGIAVAFVMTNKKDDPAPAPTPPAAEKQEAAAKPAPKPDEKPPEKPPEKLVEKPPVTQTAGATAETTKKPPGTTAKKPGQTIKKQPPPTVVKEAPPPPVEKPHDMTVKPPDPQPPPKCDPFADPHGCKK